MFLKKNSSLFTARFIWAASENISKNIILLFLSFMDDKMLKCKYLMLKNTRNKQPTNNKEIGISKKYSKVYQLLEPAIVFNFS